VPKLRAAFEERLESLESALAAAPHGGPFLGGAAPSLADLMMAPSLERFAANLPAFRGFDLRAQPGLPRLAAWYDAMEARPSYSTVRGDPGTHNVVVRKLFRLQAGAAGEAKPEEALGAGAGTGAGEAARKLVVNHEAVAADVVKNAGIGGDAVEVRAEVESALRSLAARLAAVAGIEAPVAEAVAEVEEKAAPASGPPSAEQKAAAARASAVAAATWAFMRQRVSAPRDMSGAAASALRAASLCAIAELDF
jgi:glutathione S-transferase